jgi:hypothetical protein
MSTSGVVGSLLKILSVCVTVLPPVVGESVMVIVVLCLGATTPPPDDESGAERPLLLTSNGPFPAFFTFKCLDFGCLGFPLSLIGLVGTDIRPPGVGVAVAVGVDVAVAV